MKIKMCFKCGFYGIWKTMFCPKCKRPGRSPLVILLVIILLLSACGVKDVRGYEVTLQDDTVVFLDHESYGFCAYGATEFNMISIKCYGNGYATIVKSVIVIYED